MHNYNSEEYHEMDYSSTNHRTESYADTERSRDYRRSRSPDFDDYYDEKDNREIDQSPDYRPYKKNKNEQRSRSRDKRDHSKEDRDRNYRDRGNVHSRRRDRSSSENGRDRERSRNVGRSRDNRDRSRERDRDRRKERERDRDYNQRSKKSDSHRDYDHEKNRDYDHDQSNNYNSSFDGVNYKNQIPNHTIMIRGLTQMITESDIRQDIIHYGYVAKDIRLIRKKETGASRGFAFVEFNSAEEATRWMDLKQGILMLPDNCRAIMQYSIPKDGSQPSKNLQDWHCVKCGAHNFKRRETCFKCSASRSVSEEGGEGIDEISSYPTNIILLRGLDVLSTEDSVLQTMQAFSTQPIQSLRIGRDQLTNTSRGVCYLEMSNVVDAMYLHSALTKQELEVDGKKVEIAYCKLHQTGPDAWNQHDKNRRYTLDDVAQLAEYSANLYATTPTQKTQYLQYYTDYYQKQILQGSTINLPSQSQTDRVNAAAAVAHTAIQQQLHKKMGDHDEMRAKARPAMPAVPMNTSLATGRVPAHSSDGKVYGVPDVRSFTYDETSGYYYDTTTGLYYDSNTQYYYNSQTQQFLFWDVESHSFKPVQQTGVGQTSADGMTLDPNDDSKKKECKQDKVKVAKKIAKDMERWAKTLNQKKDNVKGGSSSEFSAMDNYHSSASATADAGFAILEKKSLGLPVYAEEEDFSENGLVAAYGGGSDSEEEIENVQQEDRQHTDWGKLACLLCKRQFPNKDVLMKHQQLSNLHKQNLENWYKVRGLDPDDPQQRNNKYRDRAKERRAKYGEPEPPQPNRLKEKYLKSREKVVVPYEEPTKAGIGEDNVGNKLLQKMGWSAGMGLGKSNQGRTSIIEAERRVATAGLGSKTSSYNALPGDSYRDTVKKLMIARYQEISDD